MEKIKKIMFRNSCVSFKTILNSSSRQEIKMHRKLPTNIAKCMIEVISSYWGRTPFYWLILREAVLTLCDVHSTESMRSTVYFCFILIFSNQFNLDFPLSYSHYHNLRQKKTKIEPVWNFLNQRKIWTTTYVTGSDNSKRVGFRRKTEFLHESWGFSGN